MTNFYIKVAADHTPIKEVKRALPFEGFNTKADSVINGKPYLISATQTGFEPFDPASQVREGPVLDAIAATIAYTVRAKTVQEISDEKDAATQGLMRDARLKAFFLVAADQWGMTPAQLKAAVKAKV